MVAEITTITRDGTLAIPAELRQELNLKEGYPVVIERSNGCLTIRRATIAERTAGAGAAWRKQPPATIDDEKEAFTRAVAEENA